jgi:hypothetical protein
MATRPGRARECVCSDVTADVTDLPWRRSPRDFHRDRAGAQSGCCRGCAVAAPCAPPRPPVPHRRDRRRRSTPPRPRPGCPVQSQHRAPSWLPRPCRGDGESVQPKFDVLRPTANMFSNVRAVGRSKAVTCAGPRGELLVADHESRRAFVASLRSAPGSDKPICSTSAYETEDGSGTLEAWARLKVASSAKALTAIANLGASSPGRTTCGG